MVRPNPPPPPAERCVHVNLTALARRMADGAGHPPNELEAAAWLEAHGFRRAADGWAYDSPGRLSLLYPGEVHDVVTRIHDHGITFVTVGRGRPEVE